MRSGIPGLAFFLLILSGCIHTPTQNNTLICLGPENAQNAAVYLHGIDSNPPSSQELKNRQILEMIAKNLNIRIAVPRASFTCAEDSVCWGWATNDTETKGALKTIQEAAEVCSPSVKEIGLIGFSSGGYMTMKIFRSNLFHTTKPLISWATAIGSGMMKGPLEPEPKHVDGRLTLLIGKGDTYNFDPQQNYYHLLKKKGDAVDLVEFTGIHELPLKETQAAIADLIRSK